jgi:hypothetical protein
LLGLLRQTEFSSPVNFPIIGVLLTAGVTEDDPAVHHTNRPPAPSFYAKSSDMRGLHPNTGS